MAFASASLGLPEPSNSHHDPDGPPVGPGSPPSPTSPTSLRPAPSATPPAAGSSSRPPADSVSPLLPQLETPVASTMTLGRYQAVDLGGLDEDLFSGADFDNLDAGGTPLFLNEPAGWGQPCFLADSLPLSPTQHGLAAAGSLYPLTPTLTASHHATSPPSEPTYMAAQPSPGRPMGPTISPQLLQGPFALASLALDPAGLSAGNGGGNGAAEDGPAPAPAAMNPPSPRVTVSLWDKDECAPLDTVERTLDHGPRLLPGGTLPSNGSADQVTSIDELARGRKGAERNREVEKWLTANPDHAPTPQDMDRAIEEPGCDDGDCIPLGDATQNKFVPGQTYYGGGWLDDVDRDMILANRNWADAPVLHAIAIGLPGRHQPPSSQAAIERFERLCRDNDSIISRSATWGTRRRSHPSAPDLAAEQGITSGSFLKKLSLNRGGGGDKNNWSGGLLRDLRGLIRRPSTSSPRKRSRSRSHGARDDDATYPWADEQLQQGSREGTTPHLSPAPRASSSGKRTPTVSINTALANMAHNFAAIGTTHSRSGSPSGNSPTASPRNGFLPGSLGVGRNRPNRLRSKSDMLRPSVAASAEGISNLTEIWKTCGGPPVAALGKAGHAHGYPAAGGDGDDGDGDDGDGHDGDGHDGDGDDGDDGDGDDGDGDDLCEDNATTADFNVIDGVEPSLAGFRQHVVALNPGLGSAHGYLVDRIAHQQVVRYKMLLSAKLRHLGLGANCPCGSLCMALGGSAKVLGPRGDARGVDASPSRVEGDGEEIPADCAIGQDNFPRGIPMPPTRHLPAEVECQLCYRRKRLRKPSDWTKHVHEDAQPFTCTWDKCRDAKMFKRKADWVRHENERHRHLEWWTCNVDDCRHTCFRRDNFLQHLVREHKFVEPRVKTRAAMKQAGGTDPTWQKIGQCHVETRRLPRDEPCRFCGKAFPTWKKLTVHLAKHMERISLAVLRLAATKAGELTAETVISPVPEAPRRQAPGPASQPAAAAQKASDRQRTQRQQQLLVAGQAHHGRVGYADQGELELTYPAMAPGQHPAHQPSLYPPQHGGLGQSLPQPGPAVKHMGQVRGANRRVSGIPLAATIKASTHLPDPHPSIMDGDAEFFPAFDGLGLGSAGARQMAFDAMMADAPSTGGGPFDGHQVPLSTHVHVAHLGGGGANGGDQEPAWDERRPAGF